MFMLKEINRRDFLKASAITGSLLVAGDYFTDRGFLAYGAVEIRRKESRSRTSRTTTMTA